MTIEVVGILGLRNDVHFMAWSSNRFQEMPKVRRLDNRSKKRSDEKSPGCLDAMRALSFLFVSESQVRAVESNISKQRKHLQTRTFQEEFLLLLKKHKIEYDLRYVCEQETIQ